jgi:hypothetical protein
VLSLFQWMLLLAALSLTHGARQGFPLAVPLAFAAALLVPPINLVSALVHNALILLMPGWMTLGAARPSGIESIGFNIVSALARLLVLAICFLPAGLLFGGVWLAGAAIGQPALGLVGAAAVAAAAVVLQAALGIYWLGHFLDRFDPSYEMDPASR